MGLARLIYTFGNLVWGGCAPSPSVSEGWSSELQARYYNRLLDLQPDPTAAWIRLLSDRAERIILYTPSLLGVSFCHSRDGFLELTEVLMLCGEGPRNMAIKTLVNSWSTSSRMGEKDVLDCFFCGHHKGDRLLHYLSCDSLWTLIVSCAGLSSDYLGASALCRGGYIAPSVVECNLIACAFLVYHAIKMQRLEIALESIAVGDFSPTLHLVIELAHFHLNVIGFIKPACVQGLRL